MTNAEVIHSKTAVKKYKMFPEIDSKTSVLNYWWFRYLMVTELYMVEKWERITIRMYKLDRAAPKNQRVP